MHSSDPQATIIILNWNGWADTVECLESIEKISYDNKFIVLVDNGSRDESLGRIKEWIQNHPVQSLSETSYLYKNEKTTVFKYTLAEPGRFTVHLMCSKQNTGFTGGNNLGISYALEQSADYLWLLNNDTICDTEALNSLVELAESSQDIGIVGSRVMYYHQPDIIQSLGGTDYISWRSSGRHIGRNMHIKDCTDDNFAIEGYVYGASLLIKKQVINEIGVLDDSYFVWNEESDWCLRARRRGWKLMYCAKSEVWHKEGGSRGQGHIRTFLGRESCRVSLSRFVITGYYDIRNHLYFCRKHYKDKYVLLVILILFEIIRKTAGICIYDSYKGMRIKLLLKGFSDGLAGNMGKRIDPLSYAKLKDFKK